VAQEARASAPCCVGEPVLPCRGECRRRIHVCRRGKVRIRRCGRGAHTWFCLRTTFERILRDEVTTAAQVSSAEDSRARTVKCRRAAARSGEFNRRGRLIWAVSRWHWHTGTSRPPSDDGTPRCLLKSYPPALVHSPEVPLSSFQDHALIPSIPEPPTHSSARMLALLHPRSYPVRVVVGPPRSTHPHPRCATACEDFTFVLYRLVHVNHCSFTLESSSLHAEPFTTLYRCPIISHCGRF
jgi:hypothetical protein